MTPPRDAVPAQPATAPQTKPDPARPSLFARVFVANWHVWLVVLVAGLLSAPRLTVLLPAVTEHTDEIYQPFRALKFAATKGQAFHKYGPAPNFVLLPAYAPTIAYWKLTGQFSRPQNDYPFGLSRPLEQVGVLIFEGRLIFLTLGLIGMALLTAALSLLTGSRLAAAGGLLLVVGTNYRVQWQLPEPMPDSSMVAFALMASAAWAWTLARGVTPWRAGLFAAAAAMAAGSKENAMPLLLGVSFAMLAAVWLDARRGRTTAANARRSTFWLVGVGVGLYALTNVVYAPRVWWQRIEYWTTGPGVDGDIWGRSANWAQHFHYIGRALLDNLGPAGTPLAVVAVVAAFALRPKLAAALAVPVVIAFLVLLKISYVVDRFATPGVVMSAPLIALGLAAALDGAAGSKRRPVWSRAAAGLVAIALFVNAYWACVVFYRDAVLSQALIEVDARDVPADKVIAYGTMGGQDGGLFRLRHLRHKTDERALHKQVAAGELPDVVYVSAGFLQFMEEARDMPARAADLKNIKDFDINQWPGYRALGYRRREIEVTWPAWLAPFKWMPLRDENRYQGLLVFERPDGAAARPNPADGPATRPGLPPPSDLP